MITLKSAREIEAMDRAGDFLASIHIGLRAGHVSKFRFQAAQGKLIKT